MDSENTANEVLMRHKTLLDNVSDLVYICDTKGNILYVNKVFEIMTGYKTQEFNSKPFSPLFDDKNFAKAMDVYTRTLNGECPEYELRFKNTNVLCEYRNRPLRDKGDNIIGVIGIARDITKRKQLEEAFLHSEKLKSLGVITAGIAHEFNNILAITHGSAELLERGFKDNEELKNGLHTIKKASKDGAAIVNRMLKFAKVIKDTSDFIVYDISHLLKQAIDFTMPRWENIAQTKGINYHINKKGIKETSKTLCNPTELIEIFINIINNALDAMPDGGLLLFRTWNNDDSVFVSITDTGQGMSEDVKQNIFDPFFTTKRPKGTGLGMSITYSIVKRHGGNLDVESKEGKGTTFTLNIPIKKEIVQ